MGFRLIPKSVTLNDVDVGGRARVTRDEERVLPGGYFALFQRIRVASARTA